jgi:hypothetical protein
MKLMNILVSIAVPNSSNCFTEVIMLLSPIDADWYVANMLL